MNFGDILSSIGNFLGFGQQKKQPQQQQAVVSRPQATVKQPVAQFGAPSVQMPQQFTAPAAVQAPAPVIGGVNKQAPTEQPNIFHEIGDGINGLATAVRNNPILTAIGEANPLTALPTLLNSAPKIPQQARDLGGATVDTANFATRVPQTVNAALDTVGLGNPATTNQAYGNVQNTLQGVSNFITGNKDANANADTTKEAQAISTGKANGGDLLDAITKSLGLAATLPAGRLLGGLRAEAPLIPRPAAIADGSIAATPTKADVPAITSTNQPPAAVAPVQPALSAAPEIAKPTILQAPVPAETKTAVTAPTPITSVPSTPAVNGELGSITRNAVRDGSINTPEGLNKTVADTTAVANKAASDVGSTLDQIIRKGQAVWEKNPDATAKEASDIVKGGFTPAEQKIYQDYGQELKTLRDRSGHSLKGGDQGKWYGPRQFLNDSGASNEFDPRLVNELKRTGEKVDSNGNALDYSSTPYEHYIRRYADAANAGSQRFVDAVERSPDTGESTGVKIPVETKNELSSALQDIISKRDQIDQLMAAGDTKGADALHKEAQDATNKAFNDFIDKIPGTGKDTQAAVNRVKSLRGNYETTLAQTLTTSNVVNRVADQGTKAIESLKRPLVQSLKKNLSGKYEKIASSAGNDVNVTNTSKEATQAAKEFASGTLRREIGDNFKAGVSLAGAGRNPIMKAIAKVDATIRGAGGAALQAGDLSTSNVREALQIGASRPEASNLKTVEEYKKYFNDYVGTQKFQDDLASVQEKQNPKVGLAGGEIQKGGGISNALSKNVDNVIATQAEKAKPGLGSNRGIREVNDLVKGNVTGYAGVTSRVLGTIKDAALPIKALSRARQLAASGDEAAVARATTNAAHTVADTIALYGTTAAAGALGATKIVGYTGAQPTQGSSKAAYNKANNIPANQWFLNLPGGKRIYFDPARAGGAPGVGADIAGAAVTGSDALSTAENIGTQISDQAGGSSLPKNIVNVQTLADPSATASDKKYAASQLEALAAPSTGILNNIANFTDPTKRSPTNFGEDLRSNIPVLRAGTPASKDSQGNIIPNSKQVSGGSSQFSLANNPDASAASTGDPVNSEITRLQSKGSDVFPTSANTNADNPETKNLSKILINDPIYAAADDKVKGELLKNVLAGTSTKTINSSLSDTDKQAILDHTILGSKASAWLDNNKNAANYNSANYNNAKANGTITEKDNDLSNTSGLKYKAVAAQVDEKYGADYELKQTYGSTSQSEFKSLLNPKSDTYDPDLATKIYNYDQARSKAGIPAKYDLAKAEKVSGSGSGSGSKNFAFASLPSSLIGTKAGGSGSGSAYANNSSLYKPIQALVAPPTVAIPNGRSISVKKGIQL